jgi:hypothetical protein
MLIADGNENDRQPAVAPALMTCSADTPSRVWGLLFASIE